jgi:voltage-gated potassium channel
VFDHQVESIAPTPPPDELGDDPLERHNLVYGSEYLGLPRHRQGEWVLRFSSDAITPGLIVEEVSEPLEIELPRRAGAGEGEAQATEQTAQRREAERQGGTPFPGFFETPAGRYPLIDMDAFCRSYTTVRSRRDALLEELFREKGSRTGRAAQASKRVVRREQRSARRARKAKRRRYTLLHLLDQVGVRVGLFLVVLVAASMFGILYFETELNNAFASLWDTLWYSIVTITTVGYGDKTPITLGGKVVGLVLMGMGVIVMAAVTGQIASFLVEQQLRKREGLLKLKKLQNHFIICGWRREMERVIDGVLAANPEFDVSDLVLINNVGAEQMQPILQNPAYRGIGYINGDYIEEETLQRARIRHAARILIMADFGRDYSMQEVDSRTVMTVLTIESISKRIYVCAELLDAKFKKYLQLANCDEIILSREYAGRIIAGASTASGVSQVMMELTDTAGGRGLETREIPYWLIGEPFGKLCDYFNATYGSIVIGLMENTGNFYQRKREALGEAQKTPDISTLVDNLRSVKDLVANKPVLNPGREYEVKKNSRAIVVALSSEGETKPERGGDDGEHGAERGREAVDVR